MTYIRPIWSQNLFASGCTVASWKYIPKPGEKANGAQIDLLFDRDDGVITLCEIKFSDKAFTIDKDYAKTLANKVEVRMSFICSTPLKIHDFIILHYQNMQILV